MYYTNGNVVKNNDFSRANATSTGSTTMYGINSYYSYNTSRSTEISGNKEKVGFRKMRINKIKKQIQEIISKKKK